MHWIRKSIKRAVENGPKNVPYSTINAGTVEVNILTMVDALLKIKIVELVVN